MFKVVFLTIFALNILATSLFAEEIIDVKSSGVKMLKAEYRELFEAIPINSNMVIRDFVDGFATYEEAKKRLEEIRVNILYRSCKFQDNE